MVAAVGPEDGVGSEVGAASVGEETGAPEPVLFLTESQKECLR